MLPKEIFNLSDGKEVIKSRRTMMNAQIREYLFNYAKDLEYWIGSEEVDSINHVTNGTPTFETMEEAETYLRGLEKIIEILKENDDE